MRRLVKNLVLAAGAFAVMLLALEVVLRTTHLFGARVSWTQPDAAIGWRFTPGRQYWYAGENDHAITGRINSLGYRDRERTREKAPGTFRVAVVGDSFVEAFQVELDSTFVAIAERRLDTVHDVPVEVMNLGRSGMTITEELIVIDEAHRELSADLIVLVFVPYNDVADISPATTDNMMRPFIRVRDDGSWHIDTAFAQSPGFVARRRINGVKQRSALVSLLAERYNAWRLSRRNARIGNDPAGDGEAAGVPAAMTLCTDVPDPSWQERYALWKRVFLDTAARIEGSGGPDVLLVTVPLAYIPADIERFREVDPTFDPGCFDEDLSRAHSPYLGLQDAFEAEYRATGKPLHWAHWNYAGHRLVGRLLARKISSIIDADRGERAR